MQLGTKRNSLRTILFKTMYSKDVQLEIRQDSLRVEARGKRRFQKVHSKECTFWKFVMCNLKQNNTTCADDWFRKYVLKVCNLKWIKGQRAAYRGSRGKIIQHVFLRDCSSGSSSFHRVQINSFFFCKTADCGRGKRLCALSKEIGTKEEASHKEQERSTPISKAYMLLIQKINK